MRPDEAVASLVEFARRTPSVAGLVLLGSHARHAARPRSDVDFAVVVASGQSIGTVLSRLVRSLGRNARYVLHTRNERLVVLTKPNLLRLDVHAYSNAAELNSFLMESSATMPRVSVLVDKTGAVGRLTRQWVRHSPRRDVPVLIDEELERFLDAFERASRYASGGDAYLYWYNSTLAITRWARLVKVTNADFSSLYAPKDLLLSFRKSDRAQLEELAPSLKLPNARKELDHLGGALLSVYQRLYRQNKRLKRSPREARELLRAITARDLVWNLRDFSWVSPEVIRPGLLYRSSALARLESHPQYPLMLRRLKIRRIIDLRKPDEVEDQPYTKTTRGSVDLVSLDWFEGSGQVPYSPRKTLHQNLLRRHHAIQIMFRHLADGIPTLIHCHAGRDRTGVVMAIVGLAVGLPEEDVVRDFLATGMDLTETDGRALLAEIRRRGGVQKFLVDAGVDSTILTKVRRWLVRKQPLRGQAS